ncbi:DUF6916 family protein [Pulveribacter sp.]|nr:hypothetical protein [Pulveribacter sp.]
MNRERRTFLKAAGMASTAAASAAMGHAAAAIPASQQQLGTMTLLRSHFARLAGEGFTFLHPSGVRGSATLLHAHPLEGAEDGERSFRLVFAPNDSSLSQDTWEVSHPALGTHAIFVSPNDAQGQKIEAIFNRHQP